MAKIALFVSLLALVACGSIHTDSKVQPPATPKAQAQALLALFEHPEITQAQVEAAVPVVRALAKKVLGEPVEVDYFAPVKHDAVLAIEFGSIVGILGSILWLASVMLPVASLGAGIVGYVLSKVVNLGTVWRIASSTGAAAVLFGSGLLWAFDHPWTMLLGIIGAVGIMAVIHHNDIARWWEKLTATAHGITSHLRGKAKA